MEEIVLAEAAIGLVEKLYPKIAEAVQKGEITPEQQLALHDRVDGLHKRHRWSEPITGDVGIVQHAPPPPPIVPTHADGSPVISGNPV
jgi:hypothetical protein